MARTHTYGTRVTWTGNNGAGTAGYRSYDRSYELSTGAKPVVSGSSDPAFRGDRARWNPEELLVGAISACHQLWFLHLCSEAGVAVQDYVDSAEGTMEAEADGTARFTGVTLRPRVTVPAHVEEDLIVELHKAAHAKCVIAQSVIFRVGCEGVTVRQNEVPAVVGQQSSFAP
jgi:organic hydroperoxide reductase OsmC/OhrA